MLLYPQFFCNTGVLISACFNAESISFNVVVLLYVVKNAVVCRLLHTVFLILHITISEYHFPTNCTLYVCSCDTLFKIVKSWQHFHFSQKCTQIRNPSPLTVICKFQISTKELPWYKDAPVETRRLARAHFNREYYKVRHWADREIFRGA